MNKLFGRTNPDQIPQTRTTERPGIISRISRFLGRDALAQTVPSGRTDERQVASRFVVELPPSSALLVDGVIGGKRQVAGVSPEAYKWQEGEHGLVGPAPEAPGPEALGTDPPAHGTGPVLVGGVLRNSHQ